MKHVHHLQHPLNHVPYLPAKFEVATANGLGDAFTKNTLFDLEVKSHKMLPSTLNIM